MPANHTSGHRVIARGTGRFLAPLVLLTFALYCSPVFAQTCLQGYVWREATQGDRVCVTPETRRQAWNDNAQQDNRRQPGGGAFGFETCRQGFVWREATRGDRVCVPPRTRDQARYDNANAARRVVRSTRFD
jgi:hypothetical protein